MASKMLVDRSNSTPEMNRDVYYCVPCAIETGAIEDEELEHETQVGDAVCFVCKQPIATLPEPPVSRYTVGLHVRLVVAVDAASPVEAGEVAFDGIDIHGEGIGDWECKAVDAVTVFHDTEEKS